MVVFLSTDTNRNNINDQDKRKSVSDVVVGSKRALSENMNRSNSCKRSKQTTKTALVINRGRSSEGECSTRAEDSTTVTEAAAEIIQTNSVLMNLLVSGCDINAGYVCMNNSVKNRFNSSSDSANKYSSFSFSSAITATATTTRTISTNSTTVGTTTTLSTFSSFHVCTKKK